MNEQFSNIKTNIRSIYVSMIDCKEMPEWITINKPLKREALTINPKYFKPIKCKNVINKEYHFKKY